MSSPSHTDHRDAQLIDALRARGRRVTPQRLLIHRALCELERHSTAEEVREAVVERLPNASLPTVYSTLDLLEELGFARRVPVATASALYDARLEEHQHLVCRRCGAVEDVDVRVDMAGALAAARRGGLRPDAAEVVMRGVCAACASQ
jgi:Fe2+ or Zn2+ uptake regulation protein